MKTGNDMTDREKDNLGNYYFFFLFPSYLSSSLDFRREQINKKESLSSRWRNEMLKFFHIKT